MTARLSVNSHKNGSPGREGKIAASTCGIVSPIMMQKATMPPNALRSVRAYDGRLRDFHLQRPLSDGDGDETRFAITMLHRGLERVGAAEL